MLIESQFDISAVLEFYRDHENYEIINLDSSNSTCMIYFSSNGLYYPNNPEVFRREIVERERFEWKKNALRSVGKLVFVRDVTKQWYITGINSKINTVDLLADFLRQECEGFTIICVGSSAGGYAAALFGCLLNAQHVFCFSGQFSLEYLLKNDVAKIKNPTLFKYAEQADHRKYYSLQALVSSSQTQIFYFYPSKCEQDLLQSDLVAKFSNVYSFPFDSMIHGQTCYLLNFMDLFRLSNQSLHLLQEEFCGRLISPLRFSIRVSGFLKTYRYLLLDMPRIYLKKVRNKFFEN
jgi:hypothetical protein